MLCLAENKDRPGKVSFSSKDCSLGISLKPPTQTQGQCLDIDIYLYIYALTTWSEFQNSALRMVSSAVAVVEKLLSKTTPRTRRVVNPFKARRSCRNVVNEMDCQGWVARWTWCLRANAWLQHEGRSLPSWGAHFLQILRWSDFSAEPVGPFVSKCSTCLSAAQQDQPTMCCAVAGRFMPLSRQPTFERRAWEALEWHLGYAYGCLWLERYQLKMTWMNLQFFDLPDKRFLCFFCFGDRIPVLSFSFTNAWNNLKSWEQHYV